MSASESDSEFESADEGVVEDEEHVCDQYGDHPTDIGHEISGEVADLAIDEGINDDVDDQPQLQQQPPPVPEVDSKSCRDRVNPDESSAGSSSVTVEESVVKEDADGWGWEMEEDISDLEIQQLSSETNLDIKTVNSKHDQTSTEASEGPSAKALFDKVAESSEARQTQSGGWGWGNWSSALLSTASSSVVTFTSQVGQGLSSVLESSLGAPTPEELANQNSDPADDSIRNEVQSSISLGSFVSGVSSLTSVLEQTSSKVLSGGLNTLELLGKKTMDILQDGDPGLKNKRALIKGQSPNLSEVLREAKLKNEEREHEKEGESDEKSVYFSSVFDECQGLVHLEALEMLSSQCEKKVQMAMLAVSGDELEDMQQTMEELRKAVTVEVSDDDEQQAEHNFSFLIVSYMDQLNVAVKADKLLKIQELSHDWLSAYNEQSTSIKVVHDTAITYMAEFCAGMMELIHKICELLLLDDDRDPKLDAKQLANIVSVACVDVQLQASLYTALLNHCDEDLKSVTLFVTNIFLEATNCSSFIQDALHLTVPILQLQQCNR